MITQKTTQHVSQETGLSIHTLRWYEKIGLIPPVERAANGHRRYSEDDVRRILFINRLREAGMPIAEIKRYVDLGDSGEEAAYLRLELLEVHRQVVQKKIADLSETLAYIESKIEHYRELFGISSLEDSVTITPD